MPKSNTEATVFEQALPVCLDSERQVLGGLILDPSLADEVALIIRPEDFYFVANRYVYEAICAIIARHDTPELTTIRDELKRAGHLEEAGGINALTQLLDEVVTTANTLYHAREVRETSLRRAAIMCSIGIVQAAQNGDGIEAIEREIARLTDTLSDSGPAKPYVHISELTPECARHIEDMVRGTDTGVAGIKTGFYDLDAMTGGLMPQDLVIIAARPSMGKTAIATCIAYTVACRKLPVLIFTIETSAEQIVWRMVLQQSKVDSSHIKNHTLRESQWSDIIETFSELSALDIYIDDTADQTPQGLLSKSRMLKRQKGSVGLIIVDYLQLMRAGQRTENRNMEITTISRGLKLLAKEIGCPVMALSQLSRDVEHRPDKRPRLSDLRDSGAIEQDADLVAFLYRDEVYHKESEETGIAEIIIGKQRNGPIGTTKMVFSAGCMCFLNLAKQ